MNGINDGEKSSAKSRTMKCKCCGQIIDPLAVCCSWLYYSAGTWSTGGPYYHMRYADPTVSNSFQIKCGPVEEETPV